MARGRLISCSLSTSRKFSALHQTAGKLAEFAQSLYPLIVIHCDDFGRMSGDPWSVKFQTHPTSPRTVEDFELALAAMDRVGLIQRYDDGKDGKCLSISDFESHQTGLHKRTSSKFPEPPGNSRKFPEIPSELNRTEGKGTEQNDIRASVTEVPKQKPPVNDVQRFLQWWEWGFKEVRGAAYLPTYSKEAPIVAGLLKVYPLPRLKQMAMMLWHDDTDDWLKQTDRSIGILRAKAVMLADWCGQRERKLTLDPAPEPEAQDVA